MKEYITICFFAFVASFSVGQQSQPEMNVIYGPHFIYTIATPSGWINDKDAAKKMGLTNLFYNPSDPDDGKRAYMYTSGHEKLSPDENLELFVNREWKDFVKKYPSAQSNKAKIGFEYPVTDALMLSLTNLAGGYKEDIIYLETSGTIVVLKFVAFDKADYDKYFGKFDKEFLQSFIFRGNDPKPFLEWLENKNK